MDRAALKEVSARARAVNESKQGLRTVNFSNPDLAADMFAQLIASIAMLSAMLERLAVALESEPDTGE